MKKQDAEKLYVLANDKKVNDALLHYVELRISHLKDVLSTADTLDSIRKYQGAIEELKWIYHLRDDVNNPRD